MARVIRTAVALAAVGGVSAVCDLTALNACQKTAADVVAGGIANGKPALCGAVDTFEKCFITNGGTCDAAVVLEFKNNLAELRSALSGTSGVECAGTAKKAVPLSSGDSGSTSGSDAFASSGSEYGFLLWQIILLSCLVCCCCVGGIGGGGYYAMNMKKGKRGNGKAKNRLPETDYMPEAEVPLASMPMDMDGDGRADVIVTGVDMDRDGIPDVLEGNPNAQYVVDPVPPQVPVVDTMPVYQEQLPPIVETVQAEPTMFGPMSTLLPGTTSSTIVSGQPYSLPAYTQGQSYTTTQSYAMPTTASQYTSMPTATSQYTSQYTTPTYGAYGAYNTVPQAASSYYQGGAAAQPTYATTTYQPGAGSVV